MKKKKLLTLIIIIMGLSSLNMDDLNYAQSIRKDYREMTDDEKNAYVAALYQLHTGIITGLATYHNNNFSLIHQNGPNDDVFLAWHRRAILEMEEAIKATNPKE